MSNLKNLKESDVLLVYHGTQESHVPDLVNGFDANKRMPRYFNAPRHSGLFVAPTEKDTGSFGSIVLEIKVRAKNLHGTDYGGNIGRDTGMDDYYRKLFPNSFRPALSYSLTQAVEPQAILRGLVSPTQIKRVKYKGKWYSRKDFLALGIGKGRGYKDVGFDLSRPNYSLDQLFSMMGKMLGRSSERVEKAFQRMKEKDRREQLEILNFGPTAIDSYLKKMDRHFEANRISRCLLALAQEIFRESR